MGVKKVVRNNECPVLLKVQKRFEPRSKMTFHRTEFYFLAYVQNALVQCQKLDLDKKKGRGKIILFLKLCHPILSCLEMFFVSRPKG